MANIKYSALVSDIRGKINGSVFSKNKSGLIIRNNASGGVRATQNWNLQKSKFAKITSSWRNLTPQEQLAWNENASMLTFKNSMGEDYKISGYNYYSQVNIRRINLGLEILNIPELPEEQPNIDNFGVRALDIPQFKSMQATTVKKSDQLTDDVKLVTMEGQSVEIGGPDNGYFVITKLDLLTLCEGIPNCYYDICWDDFVISGGAKVSIGRESDGRFYIRLRAEESYNVVHNHQEILPKGIEDEELFITVYYNVNSSDELEAFVNLNGAEYHLITAMPITQNDTISKRTFYLTNANRQKFSNIRAIGLLESIPTEEEQRRINKGYLVDNFKAFSSVADISGDNVNFDLINKGFNQMKIENAGIQDLKASNGELMKFPEIEVEGLQELTGGWQYEIKSTPVTSAGLTAPRNNLKKLKTCNADDQGVISISDELEQKIGYIPNNGNIQIAISAISANGVTKTSKITAAQMNRKPKFKAGSSLSTSVN